jgi:hypothetical protein
VRAGHFVLGWSPIEVRDDCHALTIWVSSDVLRLGERGDSVRVAVAPPAPRTTAGTSPAAAGAASRPVCASSRPLGLAHVDYC